MTLSLLALVLIQARGQGPTTQTPTSEYGNFIGRVVAEWLQDGRLMKLVEPFAYLDSKGQRWDAPAGSIVDGASIPQFAWSIIGGPFEGRYRNASVIHDIACVQHQRDWQDVHNVFYMGKLASGVDHMKAKIMYSAVYHFGPRWPAVREIEQVTTDTRSHRQCAAVPFGPP